MTRRTQSRQRVGLVGRARMQALAAAQADPASTWIDAFAAIDQCLSQLTIAADSAPVTASLDSDQTDDPSCLELLEQAERVLASVPPGTGAAVAGAGPGVPDRGDPGNLRAGAVSLTTFGDLLPEAERALRLPDAAQRRRTAHGAYALGPEAGEWLQQATLAIHASHPRSGPTRTASRTPARRGCALGFHRR